jgi:diacylglycerol kinase (ATP)
MNKTLYIINPTCFGGQGTKTWKNFRLQWHEQIDPNDVRVTERPGHAQEIATSTEGYEILAVVGGDGTVNEVITGIMEHREPRPRLAIIPGGTGNDIARNVGIHSMEDALAALHGKHIKSFDLIRIDCHHDSKPTHRYAFLYVNVGFSPAPMMRPWMKRFLGPTAAYYLATLLQFMVYRPAHITARWEQKNYSGRTWMVVVGNAERISGGSMCIAPGARMDDGELNIAIVRAERPKLKMITRVLPHLLTGAYVQESDISYFLAKEIEVDSTPSVILEMDGEILGATPSLFTSYPQAVNILSPKISEKGTPGKPKSGNSK